MKAVCISRYGAPEMLQEQESEAPTPASAEVRIATHAAGINFADIMQRLGLYANAPKPPYVPGFEVAGVVDAVGADVEDLAVGDRVGAMINKGGYSDQVVVPAAQVVRLPDCIDFAAAAAIPVNYLTAWFCMLLMGNLQAGETVLIHGGAGGVGTAAVQLARRAGATIVATAGSQRKLEFLKRAGVDLPLNYRDKGWPDRVRERFGKRGIDVALDPVGGPTLRHTHDLLAPLGRVIVYGLSSAVTGPRRARLGALKAWLQEPRYNPLSLTTTNTGIFGFHLALLHGKEAQLMTALNEIIELVGSGELKPVIDSTFPLTGEGAAAAHQHIHERGNIGKVLLVPESVQRDDGSSSSGTEST